jgi:uracil-DNA glycosylase family 4
MKLKELQTINEKVKILAEKEQKHFYYGRFIPLTKFVFVGEMPTDPEDWNPYDNFNLSTSDKKFLDLLNSYGFGGCYITDIVKKTEKPRRPTEEELLIWRPLLAEELKYINPEVVVAISKDTYNTLDKNKEYLGIKHLECVWHPSYVQRYNKWVEYENQLSGLSKKYKIIR